MMIDQLQNLTGRASIYSYYAVTTNQTVMYSRFSPLLQVDRVAESCVELLLESSERALDAAQLLLDALDLFSELVLLLVEQLIRHVLRALKEGLSEGIPVRGGERCV